MRIIPDGVKPRLISRNKPIGIDLYGEPDTMEITDAELQNIFWAYYDDIIDHNGRMRFGEYLRSLIELAR